MKYLTGRVGYWPLSNDQYLNVAESLREAMTKNPYLKVWIAQGYYDMATPYFATENVVAHMFLKKDIRQNLHFTFYEAGHMVYINKPSLAQLKNDFSSFMTGLTKIIRGIVSICFKNTTICCRTIILYLLNQFSFLLNEIISRIR